MNILYLTYDGILDFLGQSQIRPYLIGLAKKGHTIHIISFEKHHAEEEYDIDLPTSLHWHPLKYHRHPVVLSTLWDILHLNRLAFQIVKSHSIDIVHCRSYVTSIVGLRIKRISEVRFIFDMRGFWADERIEGGIWNLKNPLIRLVYSYFKEKEKHFLMYADRVVSLTVAAKKEIVHNTVLSGNRQNLEEIISVIPTCVDTTLFDPERQKDAEKSMLRTQLGIEEGAYVLLYLGSLGTWYMLEEMLKFFTSLRKQMNNPRFLIVTNEQKSTIENAYASECDSMGIQNNAGDLIITKADRKDVPLYISLCNSSVFFIRPTYSKIASCATKMAEILAMGKPVVTNGGWGDIDSLVNEPIGIQVDLNSKEAYSVATRKLLSYNWDSRKIRDFAIENFDLEQGVNQYDMIYSSLNKEKGVRSN